MYQRTFRMTVATGGAVVLLGAFSFSTSPAQAAPTCGGKAPTIERDSRRRQPQGDAR